MINPSSRRPRKPIADPATRLIGMLSLIAALLVAINPAKLLADTPSGDKVYLDIEKDSLKFGFIKLTDCAPIVIAKEKGFFEDEGLQVEVIAQPNWKTLLDNVINGNLDGAHMLSGQPIAATIGFGTKAHIVTAYTLDLNGNGITVSNNVWEQMQQNDSALNTPTPKHPISAKGLIPVVREYMDSGKKLQMGMVFPVSTHNYELRYWLAPPVFTRACTPPPTKVVAAMPRWNSRSPRPR